MTLFIFLKHGDDSHALAAIKVVLDRNELYGYGVEHEAPAQVIAVQTRVNLPEVHLASMSDQDLETYRKLLEELRGHHEPAAIRTKATLRGGVGLDDDQSGRGLISRTSESPTHGCSSSCWPPGARG